MKILFIGILAGLLSNCNSGLFGSKNDDSTTNRNLAIAAIVASSSTSVCSNSTSTGTKVVNSTASSTFDSNGCVNGVTTNMDTSLPTWIKNNFICSVATVSGSYYAFKSQNVPNTKSYYYGTSSALYEALPSGNTSAGTNQIASQNFVYCIPSTPIKGTGTVGTQAGYASIGITRNGLAVYNNAAKAPDTLATEATTFDNFQGHPQVDSIYHHHAATPKICDGGANTSNSGACNNSSLIGVALDGFAIYGQKCDNGTSSSTDDFTPTDLDSLHGHTKVTQHFTTATYHYHYANDTTATIYTLMGSYFYGVPGTVSN